MLLVILLAMACLLSSCLAIPLGEVSTVVSSETVADIVSDGVSGIVPEIPLDMLSSIQCEAPTGEWWQIYMMIGDEYGIAPVFAGDESTSNRMFSVVGDGEEIMFADLLLREDLSDEDGSRESIVVDGYEGYRHVDGDGVLHAVLFLNGDVAFRARCGTDEEMFDAIVESMIIVDLGYPLEE